MKNLNPASVILFSNHKILSAIQTVCLWLVGAGFLWAGSLVEVRWGQQIVPFTMQTFAVLVIGACFSGKHALGAVATFLVAGSLGAPIWGGGAFGIAHLVGPTGGYLVGFFAAVAALTLIKQFFALTSATKKLAALLVAQGTIYACGLFWLSQFVGSQQALHVGLYPFALGACVKTAMALAVWQSTATVRTMQY